MDKKEANLLPKLCTSYNESSSSSSENSSDESTDSEDEMKFYGSSRNELKKPGARKFQKRVKKKQTKWATYISRFKRFSNSPRVHFVYEKTFFVIFLLLFSYMILCEFTYYDKEELFLQNETSLYSRMENSSFNSVLISIESNNFNDSNSSSVDYIFNENSTSSRIIKEVVKKPSWVEYLLIYWMIALMAEEARQVFIF